MAKPKSRKPDYRLKAHNKVTGKKSNNLGAAWRGEKGAIYIQLDLMVRLKHNEDITIALFPINEED